MGPHYCGPTYISGDLILVPEAEAHGGPVSVEVRIVTVVRTIVPAVAVTVIATPVIWIAIA